MPGRQKQLIRPYGVAGLQSQLMGQSCGIGGDLVDACDQA